MSLDRRTFAVSAALFLGTLLVFSRAVGNDFVNYDDPVYVTDNPCVQAGLTLEGIQWALTTDAAANWHPLTDFAHGGLVVIRGRPARTSCGEHCAARAQCRSRFSPFPAPDKWLLAFRSQWGVFCLASAASRIGGMDRRTQRCPEWILWPACSLELRRLHPAENQEVVLVLVRNIRAGSLVQANARHSAGHHVVAGYLAAATISLGSASGETAILSPRGVLVRSDA